MASLDSFLGTDKKDMFEVLNQLYSSDNLEWMTDLNPKEIRAIAIIKFLSEYAEIPEFESFISYVLKLKVSRDRKGRLEFLDGFKGVKSEQELINKIKEKMLIP